MVLGGGLGNIIQATPTAKAIAAEGHVVDLHIQPDSDIPGDQYREIFSIDSVRDIYILVECPESNYDFSLL